MTTHPLPDKTWFRSKTTVMDCGDFNEREAGPGAVGYIEGHEAGRSDGTPGTRYYVHFIPSGICNIFDDNEIDAQAEILPPGHPAIPSPQEYALYDVVSDLYAKDRHDEDGQVVFVSAARRAAIIAAFEAADAASGEDRAAQADAILARALPDEGGIALSFEDADRLAAIVGVGDRFLEQDPAPAPGP